MNAVCVCVCVCERDVCNSYAVKKIPTTTQVKSASGWPGRHNGDDIAKLRARSGG